jgi:hypothetical protein
MNYTPLDEAFVDPMHRTFYSDDNARETGDFEINCDNDKSILNEQDADIQKKKEYFDNIWALYKQQESVPNEPKKLPSIVSLPTPSNSCENFSEHVRNCSVCKFKFASNRDTIDMENIVLGIIILLFLFWLFSRKSK